MRLLSLLSFLISFSAPGQLSPDQAAQIDSLKDVVDLANHDTVKINAYMAWDDIIYLHDRELDFELNKKINELSKLNLNKDISKKELDFYNRSKASSSNILGSIYNDRGDDKTSLSYLNDGLKTYRSLGDKIGESKCLGNIASVYFKLKNYDKAIEYYQEVLGISQSTGDRRSEANSFINIGNIYAETGKYDVAIEHNLRAIEVLEGIEDPYRISLALTNLGNIYSINGEYEKALDFFEKSLIERERIGDVKGITATKINSSIIYKKTGEFNKAIELGQEALEIAQKNKLLLETRHASKSLYDSYRAVMSYSKALEMYELYITTRDSLNREENQKELIRQEYKYQYEKQAAKDSVKAAEAEKVKDAELAREKAENEQHKLESKQRDQQTYGLFGLLGIAVVFGGFVYSRYRVTQKQKGIIEEQKKQVDEAYDELEEKNTEILDSITYAKRIQSAILPPKKLVKEYLSNSFVLYKPKDIVAGDFYWMEPKGDSVLFAAADCTGHGVPGAMVSVVCNNGLNRSVREHGLTDPGKILDKTREIIISEFEKSEEEVKDGMDVALCSLEGNKLHYAGAHNPLWIIRNGASEVEEIKANKQPIGKYADPQPYTTHTIELNTGDSFYIFSDGYADQFGGERGKKFKAANFKRLLLSMQSEPMEKQRELIDEAFENWKGSLEQLDDVCVIGVRI